MAKKKDVIEISKILHYIPIANISLLFIWVIMCKRHSTSRKRDIKQFCILFFLFFIVRVLIELFANCDMVYPIIGFMGSYVMFVISGWFIIRFLKEIKQAEKHTFPSDKD